MRVCVFACVCVCVCVRVCACVRVCVVGVPAAPSSAVGGICVYTPPALADFTALIQHRADEHRLAFLYWKQNIYLGASVKDASCPELKVRFLTRLCCPSRTWWVVFTHPTDMFHYSIIYERSFIVRAGLGIFQSVHCLLSQLDMVSILEIGYLLLLDYKKSMYHFILFT